MAFIKADRVQETSISTGGGNIVLEEAYDISYRTFDDVMSNGDTCQVLIINESALDEWEVAEASYISATNSLSRTLISSSTGSTISFTGGIKRVAMLPPASKSVVEDNDGNAEIANDLAVGGDLLVEGSYGNIVADSVAVGGPLAGSADFSANDYGYIGSPYAQDPSYLGGIDISAITKANPGVITTSSPHGLSTGDSVTITMPSGMTELQGVTTDIIVLSPTTYSIGINTTAYSTYTNYATNHGRSAPSGTNLAETVGLTIRTDTVGGGGIVLRDRLYTGLMYINFANDAGDIEGTIQGNSTGNTSLSGARSFNIGFNYGDLGFWTQVQGTPVNVMTIRGTNAGSSEGYVGIGTQTPSDIIHVSKNGTPGIFLSRAANDYGVRLGTVSATGNSTLTTVGAGSTLTISPNTSLIINKPTSLTAALTYGGVTLSNAVTGTGNMVLSASPTLSGTVGGTLTFSGALTLSSALTYGGITLSNSVTGTGSMVLSASPTFTGTVGAAAITASGVVTTSALKTSTALNTATDGASTAAFTANMVASTGGPTTAAQHGWVMGQDSSGATIWIPVWK